MLFDISYAMLQQNSRSKTQQEENILEKRKKPSIPKPVVGKTNQQMQKEIPYYKIDIVKGLKDQQEGLTYIDANVLSMAEASAFLARARGKVDKNKMAD